MRPRSKARTFGPVIRDRRRRLDLYQDQLARRMRISAQYLRLLESGKRHPSDKVVARLAEVLGLDRRELFLLANPRAQALLSPEPKSNSTSAWEEFRNNERLRRIHHITTEEMEMLSEVALFGEVRAARDFIYILHAVRQALGGSLI